jgi:hypothetical protein
MWTPKKLAHLEAMRNPPPKPRHRWQFVRNGGKRKLVPVYTIDEAMLERRKAYSDINATFSQIQWLKISDNLDAYNRRVGRI